MATIDTIADRSTGSAIAGKAYFETSTNKFIVYNGSAWIELDSDGTGAVFENRWGASFDGTGDYMTTDNSVLNFYNTGGSISAWIKPSSVTGTGTDPFKNRSIINKGNVYLSLNVDESGYPVLYFYDGAVREVVATTQVSTSSWMHICATWSTTGSSIYVNGTSEATSSNTPANITSSQTGATVYMGRTPTVWDYFGGLIDELAVFNTELSSSNVSTIYNSGVPSDISALSPVNWWRMGDDSSDTATSGGSIATITDSSGNGNDMVQATASSQPTFKALAQLNAALDFNGSTEFLTINASANNSLHTGGSWSFWMHHSVASSMGTPIFTDSNEANYMAVNFYANKLYIYANPDNHDTNFQASTGWNFITLTATGSSISVHQFSNDYPTGRVFTKTISSVHDLSASEVYFAKSGWGAGRFFNGMLNDVAFFSNALSANELTAMYNSGAPIDLTSDSGNYSSSSSLLGYWRMGDDDSLTDGASASQITDASGNGNHATQATAANQPTASIDPVIYV